MKLVNICAGMSALVAVLVTAAACNIPDQEDPSELNKAQQLWGGEAACATVSISNATIGAVVAAPTSAGEVDTKSPDDRYDSVSCPRQWVVEVTGWNGSPGSTALPYMTPIPFPDDATECANTFHQINYYGYNGTWSTKLYTRTFEGGWGGSSCTMYEISDSGSKTNLLNGTYTKIRAAMQAWTWLESGTRVDYKLINAQIQWPPS